MLYRDYGYFISVGVQSKLLTFDVVTGNHNLHRIEAYYDDKTIFKGPLCPGAEVQVEYLDSNNGDEYYLTTVVPRDTELMHVQTHNLRRDHDELEDRFKKLEKRFYTLEKYYQKNMATLNNLLRLQSPVHQDVLDEFSEEG